MQSKSSSSISTVTCSADQVEHGEERLHWQTSQVKLRAIEKIRPNPNNSRTHNGKQRRKIAASIKKFGFCNPILIDEGGTMIAGHGRYAAAKDLGLTKVPVIVLDHLSDAEKRAYIIADNRIAQDAGWDNELLAIELEELSAALPDMGLDLEITGFEAAEIDLILESADEDKQDPADDIDLKPAKQITTKAGDIWLLGKHRICCGDARSPKTVTKILNGQIVRMVITDPPYNVPVNGHVGGRGAIKHVEFAHASGEMTTKQFRKFLKSAIKEMINACDDDAILYIFIDWRHVEDLTTVGRKLDLELRNICVWNKTTPGQGSFYRSAHELIVVFSKQGAQPNNNIELGRYGRNRTNVWSYPGVNTFKTGEGSDLAIHPTVKPIAMISDAIKDASKRGDIILDSFLGSGTTLLACERTGRICCGIEVDPSYVDLAIRRWQELTGKDALLENTNGEHSLSGLSFEEVTEQCSKSDDTTPPNLVDGRNAA